MDRFKQRFLSQVQVLQDQLENLLEKDWGPNGMPQARSTPTLPFETQTDLSQLETLGWSLPLLEPERSSVLFERLRPYFECGFCFHRIGSQDSDWIRWRWQQAFSWGGIQPLLPEDLEKEIAFPNMTLIEIRKLKTPFLLSELKLEAEVDLKQLTSLVIRPSDQRLWVLLSSLPDIFLKPHLTTIQENCLKLLADFSEHEEELR